MRPAKSRLRSSRNRTTQANKPRPKKQTPVENRLKEENQKALAINGMTMLRPYNGKVLRTRRETLVANRRRAVTAKTKSHKVPLRCDAELQWVWVVGNRRTASCVCFFVVCLIQGK